MATTYLDATVPADGEAATLGALRIRTLQAQLNTLIAQIWNSSGAFLPNWITGAGSVVLNPLLTNLIAPGAIGTADIAPQAITEALLAPGALGNDAAGYSKMANYFIQSYHLSSGLQLPAQSVGGNALGASAVQLAIAGGVNPIGVACITAQMLAGKVPQAVVGSFAGSSTSSAVVNSLPFAPTVLILFPGTGLQGFGISLLSEASGGASNVHASWVSGTIVSPDTAAVQWSSNGFTVLPYGFYFNSAGQTHTYVALAI